MSEKKKNNIGNYQFLCKNDNNNQEFLNHGFRLTCGEARLAAGLRRCHAQRFLRQSEGGGRRRGLRPRQRAVDPAATAAL